MANRVINTHFSKSAHYTIDVEGKVGNSWSDWFEGLVFTTEVKSGGAQVTVLSGVIKDQAALRGILNRLWDLNMILISLQKTEGGKDL